MIKKIISGGQSGADRAALDWAIAHDMPHGGWCPKRRLAEDGPIPDHYQLIEADSLSYAERTRLNVRDSDGTLILNLDDLDGGSLLTERYAAQLGRPCLVVQLDGAHLGAIVETRSWLGANRIRTLNIAGPRASKRNGIYPAVRAFLDRLIASR